MNAMSQTRILWAAVGLAVVSIDAPAVGTRTVGFPPRLDEYLTRAVAISVEERKTLLAGAPVTKMLDGDKGKEVGVFGAVWVNAPVRRYVEAVSDIEQFERGGGFTLTKRIGAPPKPEDFADMRLPDEDVEDLRKCRVGDCVVKLDAEAIQTLQAEVDWKSPNARATINRIMQRFALTYVTGYLEGGNERLATYRDHERPTFVAEEFRTMIGEMPELTTYMPNLRRYLLEYPASPAPSPASFLYWQETNFGLRPTIRISHLSIWETLDGTAVASKMLYASHYFWTGLELRVLLPDPSRGQGFWFVMVNRSRSDGLSGFTGRVIRGRVRSEVQKGMLAGLLATRKRIEPPAGSGAHETGHRGASATRHAGDEARPSRRSR
jgi:hypothetical protein